MALFIFALWFGLKLDKTFVKLCLTDIQNVSGRLRVATFDKYAFRELGT